MKVRFTSCHVDAATSTCIADGCLRVEIAREDPRAGQTVYDQVSFSVPPDFHAHNDLVAAALMTLVGRRFRSAAFNFPISERCATLLRRYYRLDDVGPVDSTLAPRQPGRHVAVSFSGGLDSTAALILLKQVAPDAKVITSDYGGPQSPERAGFQQFPRDITCATDFREKGYDRGGRFHYAVPLLFADYLDLRGVAPGHGWQHEYPLSIESLDRGQEPRFREEELPINAGGLEELHLIRGLTTIGIFTILLEAAPDRLETGFAACCSPGRPKYAGKALMLRWLYAERGLPIPSFLENLTLPPPSPGYAIVLPEAFFIAKHFGRDVLRHFSTHLASLDLSILDELTFSFMGKYNPNFVRLLPPDIRDDILAACHGYGIYPYDERDWREFGMVRDLVTRAQADVDRRRGLADSLAGALAH